MFTCKSTHEHKYAHKFKQADLGARKHTRVNMQANAWPNRKQALKGGQQKKAISGSGVKTAASKANELKCNVA